MSQNVSKETSAECPFPPSNSLKGIKFTSRYAHYTDADTWYPSWAEDGRMYSPFTDTIGKGVNGLMSRSDNRRKAVVGHAAISGDDPMNLIVSEEGLIPGPGRRYKGRYPSASLFYRGNWYIGTYGLAAAWYGLNWPIMGPFAGFHISHDKGLTWTPSPFSTDPGKALFLEPEYYKGPVKLGAPHVVDFGKELEHSPDGKMYLVGHGSREKDRVSRKANCSWITGDEVYLCRVSPDPSTVNDPSAYEFFSGHNKSGDPVWSSHFKDIQPLVSWKGKMGSTSMTYNPSLKKYIMCVTDGWPTVKDMDSYILESDQITGPWKMVQYLEGFGPQAYFLNFPSRFISEKGEKAWLCYSANFAYNKTRMNPDAGNPKGSKYSLCLQELEFLK